MVMLSDGDIVDEIRLGGLRIDPFSEASLSSAGYDLRSGDDYIIPRGELVLVHTLERVELPAYLSGQLFIRSSFAREGLVGSFALVDPGFQGQLTLAILNMGKGGVTIAKGERVAQIVMTRLATPSLKPYSGRYQNSKGPIGSKRNF